jgi:hypothetical protein
MNSNGAAMTEATNLIIKPVGHICEYKTSSDPRADVRQIIGAMTDSRIIYRGGGYSVRLHLDDNGFAKQLEPNFRYPYEDLDVPGIAVFTCEDEHGYVPFNSECLRVVHDVLRGLARPHHPSTDCDPIGDFWDKYSYEGSKEALILMPLARLISDDQITFDNGRIVLYPPAVEWEHLNIQDPLRLLESIEGAESSLGWSQNASTRLGIADLEPLALCAQIMPIDDVLFHSGNHKYHAQLIRDAADRIEELLDIVRFEQCRIRVPEGLPGRAGLIPTSMFSAAVVYMPWSSTGLMIGNSIETHAIVGGIGIDAYSGHYMPVAGGEVAMLLRRGLAMFSEFLTAGRQTQQFMLGISLLEFLASPDEYTKMNDVKREIASLVATDKIEYHRICDRFRKLTSEDGNSAGLRTQIVHFGRTFEDIVTDREQRLAVLEELEHYAGCCLQYMFDCKDETWDSFVQRRSGKRKSLGVA